MSTAKEIEAAGERIAIKRAARALEAGNIGKATEIFELSGIELGEFRHQMLRTLLKMNINQWMNSADDIASIKAVRDAADQVLEALDHLIDAEDAEDWRIQCQPPY